MDDAELRHWQEVEHHLTELTRHPGWGALTEYAHIELMKGIKHRILNGSHKTYDWDTYLRDTGFCMGIHALLDAHKEVAQKVTSEMGRRRELAGTED